jgi:glucosamine 6-phosphate synthetase-like amidotransferase/phosphosugar isomerase protein
MCGIVCFFGQAEGVTRVLEALHLLEYRAPDSAGLAALAGEEGKLVVRRSVGPPRRLVATLASDPMYAIEAGDGRRVADMLVRQGIDCAVDSLRECSPARGYTLHDLYTPGAVHNRGGLRVGIGDRGGLGVTAPVDWECQLSARMRRTLEANGALSSPDYDQDPVRHAFRLVAAHVASRVAQDQVWKEALDRALLARVPAGAYASWRPAWEGEAACNTPGQAFAVAVRHFQETFPGLAEHLNAEDWERVGGLTAQAMAQVVIGHGRWAMVGAVTEANAHPLLDRSRTRAICENGSHNASLVLGMRAEQEAWWRARGVPEDEPVHRSENTTEVIVYEWERAYHQLNDGDLAGAEQDLLTRLEKLGINHPEEQALRLALLRLRAGNTHACTFYSRQEPGVLYVSSHYKPIAIAIRAIEPDGEAQRYELMVASDVNAALMLWPGSEVDAAAERIHALQKSIERGGAGKRKAQRELEALLKRFTVDVIFLDADLYQGRELMARITQRVLHSKRTAEYPSNEAGRVVPEIQVSRYDGTPITVTPQQVRLNPAMVGRRGYDTYTESHIAEIPDVLDGIVRAYIRQGRVRLNSIWREEGTLLWPGLNVKSLRQHYRSRLKRLRRLLLVGEGSSWRDAQSAAPLFRDLLPGVVINVYRPLEVLNMGEAIDPIGDLAVEISWSGTTDSVLKVDDWLAEMEVMRLSVTGRPQNDLGRRTAASAGTLDVRSGVEVSVATVKGFEAILATLDLLALQLARMRQGKPGVERLAQLTRELMLVVPRQVRGVIEDQSRRQRTRQVAERCRDFNKVAVVGGSPVDIEGELKVEELAQIVANTFEFHSASLRSLIERSAIVDDDRQRTLFIINATAPERHWEARAVVNYLSALGVFCIIHTTPHAEVAAWEAIPTAEVFVSPSVSDPFQPLIDAPFFFDLAVALAYARGLSPEDIDRPRNLAKSVTTTAAERRAEVEGRQEFYNVTLADFGSGHRARAAWDVAKAQPSRAALRATVALRAALALISEPLPERLDFQRDQHLLVITDTEATENAAQMAAAAWQSLLGIDLVVYRRFITDLPEVAAGTALLRLIRAGAVLSARDPHTIALPSDMSPLQLEMLAAVYLTGLAVRLARQRGRDTTLWEAGLAQLPLLVADVLASPILARQVNAFLSPFVRTGYDKIQIIGGGQDHASARSIARSFRTHGFMAEALYTDSAWHGPLATVGGPDADHDTLMCVLATDPLFQAAALVDTQVYRTRHAPVLLVVPEGNQDLGAVRGVDPSAVLSVPALPRPFVPVVNVALGAVLAQEMARLWEQRDIAEGGR